MALISGCRTEEVPVTVMFPSQDHFLHSKFIRVVMFQSTESCSVLKDRIATENNTEVVFDSGLLSICEFYRGDVLVPALPDDNVIFVGQALERDARQIMLEGCSARLNPRDVADAQGSIEFLVTSTAYYDERGYPAMFPDPSTAEVRCAAE